MRLIQLTYKNLRYFRRQALTVALGMAVGMTVITGALVTGDSVRGGLQNLVGIRLGNVDLSVTMGDRYVTDSLAIRMSADLRIPAAAVLQLGGSATAGGGTMRLPKIQVYGVDDSFRGVLGPETFSLPLNENEAVISDNLASRLGVQEGEEILIRISKPGPVPIDAPFVSDAGNIVSVRITIKKIAGKADHGRFSLQNTQTAPFNLFMSRQQLQKLAGLEGLSNLILMTGNGEISTARAEQSLARTRVLRDASLHLDKHPATGEWVLRTPRVFFDLPTLSAIKKYTSDKTLWFSYFVNEFRADNRATPYSFVSTLPGEQIRDGETVINQWLADDLNVSEGDSITMSYFMVGPLRNLTVEKARFRISAIIPMNDPLCDRLLMPEIPGLSDAGNCRDWDTGIPIDLKSIRDKDEDYWKTFRGTPKAFINSAQAARMWQNRFGKFTQIRFTAGSNPAEIERGILSQLKPSETGITVHEPAQEGDAAASSGVDFSGLFLGLSCFLIFGGIILTILLIRLGLEGRLAQIGTLRAIGWPEHRIRKMLLGENLIVSIIAVLIGLILTWFYNILIFKALNGVWNSIVLTDTLRPVFKPLTLVAGTLAGLALSQGSSWIALNRFFRRKPSELIRRNNREQSALKKRVLQVSSGITGVASAGLLIYGLIRIQSVGPTYFFIAGTFMLCSLLLVSSLIIRYQKSAENRSFSLASLGRSNIRRNPGRSLSVILLFAIGIFMVIAIGANRKVEGSGAQAPILTGGTGGFLFYMETTVPVADNLNKTEIRAKFGLESPSEFIQMKRLEGDDASCLNLNRVNNPPLLGVPVGAFSGRFRFSSLVNKEFSQDPWKILEQKMPNGVIPAVADQTVIQWGLGLKAGDTLSYKSGVGDTVKIVLVGGLANSVFQGSLLISEEMFIRYWPSVSGTNVSLVSGKPSDMESMQTDILRAFRDYGTDLKPASEKLAEFNSIENTYLSIFLVMGALAMLLGTIGLAVILARNLQERRSEIALLRATGFSKFRIFRLVVREYSALLLYGSLAGGIPSLVCVLPGLFNPSGEVSLLFLLSVLVILLANGFLWIALLGWNSVNKPEIIQSLRTE